jgi:hypothetical protein
MTVLNFVILALAVAAGVADQERGLRGSAGDAAPSCTPQFAPLDTGSSSARSDLPFWRKDQAGEWGGEGWLGWAYDGKALVPVVLTVTVLEKEESDDDDEVTVYSVPEVSFAARCIDGLQAGNIRSADIANHELQFQGPLRITLGERRYTLGLHASREDLADAQVVLTDGQQAQVLYAADGFADDPHFYVVWAGDLDGDGELDLVVNLSAKYSMHPYRLLLSSWAADGDLVGEAASFESGC